MPVCGNYLFFELPKKIVLNPKDGNTRSYNHLFGHRACNRAYFAEKYPNIAIRYACDDSLSDGIYRVTPAAPSKT